MLELEKQSSCGPLSAAGSVSVPQLKQTVLQSEDWNSRSCAFLPVSKPCTSCPLFIPMCRTGSSESSQLVWNLINKKLSISGEKRIWQSSPGIPRQLQRIPGRRNYLEGKLCILLFSPAASMALPTQVIPCPSLCSSCPLQMACVVSCGTQRLWFPLHAL